MGVKVLVSRPRCLETQCQGVGLGLTMGVKVLVSRQRSCLETKTKSRPDSMARLWKICIYFYIQKQTVHCWTMLKFISTKATAAWIHVNYDSLQLQTKTNKRPVCWAETDDDDMSSTLLTEPIWKHDPLLYCSSVKVPITCRRGQITHIHNHTIVKGKHWTSQNRFISLNPFLPYIPHGIYRHLAGL